MSGDIIVFLIRERVKNITFALYTTHIFQILAVVLFGALKKPVWV
jgi:nitrate reductase NapE component